MPWRDAALRGRRGAPSGSDVLCVFMYVVFTGQPASDIQLEADGLFKSRLQGTESSTDVIVMRVFLAMAKHGSTAALMLAQKGLRQCIMNHICSLKLMEFLGPRGVRGRELSKFLSAYVSACQRRLRWCRTNPWRFIS